MSQIRTNPDLNFGRQTGFTAPATTGREQCVCPACGRLECLCRPRFFAGQLLTEEDLNRLDHYLRAKNRLHNRYLHGWGTVCGLEVLCHACPEWVKVSAGYALDPCGEDIILCADEELNLCRMIQECRKQDVKKLPCDPPRRRDTSDGCEGLTETWLLSIEYDEKQTRGVTSLRGASAKPCCDRCSCDAQDQCGCRCEASSNGTNDTKKTNGQFRPSPTQCEPTVVCETYRFGVCRMPEFPRNDDDDDMGPLVDRIVNCWREIITSLDADLLEDEWSAETSDPLCRAKMALNRFMTEHPTTFCDWDERLALITCPDPAENGYAEAVAEAIVHFIIIVLEYLVHCFCSAWLPQCPDVVCDARVPLATVTVTSGKCRVVRICNLTRHRHFVRTAPNMKYWFSPLGVGRFVREALESLCCNMLQIDPVESEPDDSDDGSDDPLAGAAESASFSEAATASDAAGSVANKQPGARKRHKASMQPPGSSGGLRDMSTVLLSALSEGGDTMDVQQLYRSLTGTRDNEGKLLGEVENPNHLPMWFAVKSMLLPAIGDVTPGKIGGLSTLLRSAVGSNVLSKDGGGISEVLGRVVLRPQVSATEEITSLRNEITVMNLAIEELRKKNSG